MKKDTSTAYRLNVTSAFHTRGLFTTEAHANSILAQCARILRNPSDTRGAPLMSPLECKQYLHELQRKNNNKEGCDMCSCFSLSKPGRIQNQKPRRCCDRTDNASAVSRNSAFCLFLFQSLL